MTDPRNLSGALWMLCADIRATAHAGAPIAPARAAEIAVMIGNLAQTAADLETAPMEALADTLAAIEAAAARGVVVRFPQRAHSDALHGDGAVA